MKFTLTKSFGVSPHISERTIQVAAAFGFGIDDLKDFTVYENLELDIHPGDVIYVTGDSGSGKSILLNAVKDSLKDQKEFAPIGIPVDIPGDEVIVEGVGRDLGEALKTLSAVGLNEAFIFVRRFGELSDGQKFRYRLAKMIDSGAKTWVIDEFCATLDREMAMSVSYSLQKAARRVGATVIAATTHTDLVEDLQPSLVISKRFGSGFKVERKEVNSIKPCSLMTDIEIRLGNRNDFLGLEEFHYKAGLTGLVKQVWVAHRTRSREIVGGVAYFSCHMMLAGRNQLLPQYHIRSYSNVTEMLQAVNRDIVRLGRIVVLPKYRSIGLAMRIMAETLPQTGVPYVETLAVMAHYNPFFERMGFIRANIAPYEERKPSFGRALATLQHLGFNTDLLSSAKYNMSILEGLSPQDLEQVRQICLSDAIISTRGRNKFKGNPYREGVEQGDLSSIAMFLTAKPQDPLYLVWKNPAYANYPNPGGA